LLDYVGHYKTDYLAFQEVNFYKQPTSSVDDPKSHQQSLLD